MDTHSWRRLVAHVTNNIASLKDVTVTYSDGSEVSGFVTKIDSNSDLVVLCKHAVLRSEDPQVVLDPGQIDRVVVELHGGGISTF